MDETKKERRTYFRKPTRVLAAFLAVVMLLTTAFTASALAGRVTIRSSNEPGKAAVNYLAKSTEYMNRNAFQRMPALMGDRRAPSKWRDYYALAGAQIARELYDLALISIDKCIEMYNDEDESLLMDLWMKKGCLHVMNEEHEEALIAMNKVLEMDTASSDAYLVKAQIFASLGMYQNMYENLEYYLELVPDDQEVILLLAQIQETLEKETRSSLQAVDENSYQKPTVESEYLEGLHAMQSEDYALAEAALSRAIALDSSYEGVNYYRGVCRLSLENYSGAVADFTDSINNGYMVHSSYYNRGISLIMENEHEEGQKDIILAAELSEDPSVKSRAEDFLVQIEEYQNEAQLAQYLTKAQLCSELKDMAGVCENLEAYLEEAPSDIFTRTSLAQARYANEDYKEALEQYAIVLKSEQNAEIEYMYGMTALQLSEFILAEKALSRSIAIDDNCLNVYYYRGVCRLSLDDYKGAVEDFTVSIISKDMVQGSLFNRGVSYLMMDKTDLGTKDLIEASDMNEDAEIKKQAKQLLTEIKQ